MFWLTAGGGIAQDLPELSQDLSSIEQVPEVAASPEISSDPADQGGDPGYSAQEIAAQPSGQTEPDPASASDPAEETDTLVATPDAPEADLSEATVTNARSGTLGSDRSAEGEAAFEAALDAAISAWEAEKAGQARASASSRAAATAPANDDGECEEQSGATLSTNARCPLNIHRSSRSGTENSDGTIVTTDDGVYLLVKPGSQ
ncbi:hypothetical protein [Roseovarius sp. MMSF_3350]|uniref:hypothetical protein n=1 Tax=Roseovarius sp. MMSF_3350 TaxID=3046706 RepID=UPI00273E8AED|nr:hypothetical protein [Roseovarius sp. MMSF_3350]